MKATADSKKAFELRLLWIAFGILLEFLFIPNEIRGANGVLHHSSSFANADFYYAILSPVILWWFFHFVVSSKKADLGRRRVPLLNFVFGFYLWSVVRAVLAAFFAIHLGVWTVTSR